LVNDEFFREIICHTAPEPDFYHGPKKNVDSLETPK